MVNMNHILAGSSAPVRNVPGVVRPAPDSPKQNPTNPANLEVDRFTTGQPWKNKATATVNGSGCRCGSCSECGAKAYSQQQRQAESPQGALAENNVAIVEDASAPATVEKGPTGEALRPEELAQLQELQKIDQKVRSHEQAHMGAAGGLATSGISLSYQKGPDGQSYAVGGEVSIDTSRASTPRETVAKMMKVRAAALAPSDPSAQDRKVAASASTVMGEARAQMQLEAESSGVGGVEQAVQNILGEGDAGNGDDERVNVNGSYQRSQYQKVAAGENDGGPLGLAL